MDSRCRLLSPRQEKRSCHTLVFGRDGGLCRGPDPAAPSDDYNAARVGELLSICARLNVLLAKPRVREGSNTPNFASTEGMTALRQVMTASCPRPHHAPDRIMPPHRGPDRIVAPNASCSQPHHALDRIMPPTTSCPRPHHALDRIVAPTASWRPHHGPDRFMAPTASWHRLHGPAGDGR